MQSQDTKEAEFSGVDARERNGIPLPTGIIPSLAKGTGGIELAGRAEKPPLQSLRRWSPEHMVRQGTGEKRHCRAGQCSTRQCKRMNERAKHCHQRVGANHRHRCERENAKRCAAKKG